MLTYECPKCGHVIRRVSVKALSFQIYVHERVSHEWHPTIVERVS